MTEIVLLFAEITTEAGYGGISFSYSNGLADQPSTPTRKRSPPKVSEKVI